MLAARVPGLSRRRARIALDLGGVFVDGKRVKLAGRVMQADEKVEVHLGGALERATKRVGAKVRDTDEASLPPFKILHEDDDIIVVDKPAGLLSAPTPESDRGNLLSVIERRGNPATRSRHFIVHRLDLPTSGILVVARNEYANRELSERFRLHDLNRQYLGIVQGAFPDAVTTMDAPVAGRTALTHVRIESRFADRATMLRFALETGRTHQIRLHVKGVGHPLLGDREHGRRTDFDPPRLALHATILGFPHPRTGEELHFESPWPPPDLAKWFAAEFGAPVSG